MKFNILKYDYLKKRVENIFEMPSFWPMSCLMISLKWMAGVSVSMNRVSFTLSEKKVNSSFSPR